MAGIRLRGVGRAGQAQPGSVLDQGPFARGQRELPEPEVLAAEITEDLRSALEAFEEIAEELARS